MFVDGKASGITPVVLTDMPFGSKKAIRVEKISYQSQKKHPYIQSEGHTVVNFVLKKEKIPEKDLIADVSQEQKIVQAPAVAMSSPKPKLPAGLLQILSPV